MALPAVTLNRTSGGIGRQLSGTDYYSGMIYYFPTTATLPTGFQTNAINVLHSITDLEALGVTGNSSDETKGTGTYLITTKGNTGDTIEMKISIPVAGSSNVSVSLGVYTVGSSDTTIALQGAAWAVIINAGTYSHGFTASFSTATLTITNKAGLGASLNSGTPISITLTGAFAGTITQISGGVGSQYDVLYYHVKEFFRMQGIINGKAQGQLWLGCYKTAFGTFTEVETMQSFANGAIKQMGVFQATTAFASSQVTNLQARATTLQGLNTPLSIIYQGDISATSDLTTLPNMRALTNKNVSVVIGQDGGGLGGQLYLNLTKSVGIIGTTLGAVALAAVNESILWRGKFDAITATEFVTLAWANGSLQSASGSGLNALMTALDAYGYNFLMHETDLAGSYWNNDNTSIASSSDYAYIADNRTIDKACRLTRSAILPSLGSPLTFNSDGTLTADTIGYFEGLGDNALAQMINAGEISVAQTVIDPSQNVQSTQILAVTIKIVQRGVARSITINIGFVASL